MASTTPYALDSRVATGERSGVLSLVLFSLHMKPSEELICGAGSGFHHSGGQPQLRVFPNLLAMRERS